MSDESFELSRRKLLGGLTTLGVAGAASGAGTFALFSDTESSTGNSVQAGTLDLTAGASASFDAATKNLKPGQSTNTLTIALANDGSIDGDHVEVAVSYAENDGTEPSDSDLSQDASADAFAKHLFVKTLDFGANHVGWGFDDLLDLRATPGSMVFDQQDNGNRTIHMQRADDPAGTGRDGVLHVSSHGNATRDYAVSMREVGDVPLENVSAQGDGGTEVTYDYYEGSANDNAAPDEVWLVVDDADGNRHLLFQSGNDGDSDASTEEWTTRDVGAEITGSAGFTNDGRTGASWMEATPDGVESVAASDLASAYRNLVAVGFGRGFPSSSSGTVVDSYYADLVVGEETLEFRPTSLWDLANHSKLDPLAGLDSGATREFKLQFELDALAGNDLQGDGVNVNLTFGLAQKTGQDVI